MEKRLNNEALEMVNGGNGEDVEGLSSRTMYNCYSCGHSWWVLGTGLCPICPKCGSHNTGTDLYKDDEPDWE